MFLFYMLLWIIFNSRITWEIILIGIPVCALIYGFSCLFFGFSLRKDIVLMKKLSGILHLLLILFSEILKANFDVIRRIYSSRKPDPVFTTFDVPLKHSSSLAALSDCITLTPGTITGIQTGSTLTVHCLDTELSAGLQDSVFVQKLQKLEDLSSDTDDRCRKHSSEVSS